MELEYEHLTYGIVNRYELPTVEICHPLSRISSALTPFTHRNCLDGMTLPANHSFLFALFASSSISTPRISHFLYSPSLFPL